ncbi:hypothetical protein CO731_01671 [Aminobacter sp. MSH1]|uniref:hypothetical protein n=1 Tax=Aminobacter sp. MSH1 TaxID=374606 RepID=UPI000D371232|nr:hypothetical protein [Aminobacter sp. MSH1]AWC22215.1 hypothetical protein CO731_01671 [Aminobacter sp. MSH1]
MSTAEEERERIRAITGTEVAKRLPTLASTLAIETDFSAEEAMKILAIAASDVDAQVAAATARAAVPMPMPARSGVGLGMPETRGRPDAAEGWHKAVEHTNRHASPDAIGGEASATGWARAMQSANRRVA